jgi:hypothetical protein
MPSPQRTEPTSGDDLTDLLYELLDAHWDTTRLASDLEPHPSWHAHLDYLRDLQRLGREALAHAGRRAAA